MKYENYIREIQTEGFYAGNLELDIAYILFKLNISVYKLDNINIDIQIYVLV